MKVVSTPERLNRVILLQVARFAYTPERLAAKCLLEISADS